MTTTNHYARAEVLLDANTSGVSLEWTSVRAVEALAHAVLAGVDELRARPSVIESTLGGSTHPDRCPCDNRGENDAQETAQGLTAAQLDALPDGARVRDREGDHWEARTVRNGVRMWRYHDTVQDTSRELVQIWGPIFTAADADPEPVSAWVISRDEWDALPIGTLAEITADTGVRIFAIRVAGDGSSIPLSRPRYCLFGVRHWCGAYDTATAIRVLYRPQEA